MMPVEGDLADQAGRVGAEREHEREGPAVLPLAPVAEHGLRDLGDRRRVLAGPGRRVPRMEVGVVVSEEPPELADVSRARRAQDQALRRQAGRQRRDHKRDIPRAPRLVTAGGSVTCASPSFEGRGLRAPRSSAAALPLGRRGGLAKAGARARPRSGAAPSRRRAALRARRPRLRRAPPPGRSRAPAPRTR